MNKIRAELRNNNIKIKLYIYCLREGGGEREREIYRKKRAKRKGGRGRGEEREGNRESHGGLGQEAAFVEQKGKKFSITIFRNFL